MRTPAFRGSVGSAASHVLTPMITNRDDEQEVGRPVHRKVKRSETVKLKVPRPANAFILYRQYHHPMIKRAHPELHNNDICEHFLF